MLTWRKEGSPLQVNGTQTIWHLTHCHVKPLGVVLSPWTGSRDVDRSGSASLRTPVSAICREASYVPRWVPGCHRVCHNGQRRANLPCKVPDAGASLCSWWTKQTHSEWEQKKVCCYQGETIREWNLLRSQYRNTMDIIVLQLTSITIYSSSFTTTVHLVIIRWIRPHLSYEHKWTQTIDIDK